MDRLDTIPGNVNLGFVYLTDRLAAHLDSILEFFRSATGVADWTGSVGSAICCSGEEVYDAPAVAIMLAGLPANSYRLIPADLRALADRNNFV